MKRAEQAPGNARASGTFSTVLVSDDLVFVSGTGPFDEKGRLVSDDFRTQATQTIENVGRALEAAACTFEDVVKVTTWLTDLANFDAYNEVYGEYFSPPYPARSTVTSDLRGFKIEMEALARRPGERRDEQKRQALVPRNAATPVAPASLVLVAGDLVFVSGTGPFDSEGRLVSEDFREQAQYALENVGRALEAASCSYEDVVKVTTWVTELSHLDVYDRVFANYFSPPYPARTDVTSRLRGFDVEIEALARRPTAE